MCLRAVTLLHPSSSAPVRDVAANSCAENTGHTSYAGSGALAAPSRLDGRADTQALTVHFKRNPGGDSLLRRGITTRFDACRHEPGTNPVFLEGFKPTEALGACTKTTQGAC